MITKSDAVLLITEIQNLNKDLNCNSILERIVTEPTISLDILKFINDHRQLDLTTFYEKLRTSYNQHKSKLYKNIVSDISEDNINEVPIILNSYALQCLLFEKQVKDKQMFERFSRLEEVYRCLHYYSKTHDLIPCIKVLNLIKVDIKALESIYREQI